MIEPSEAIVDADVDAAATPPRATPVDRIASAVGSIALLLVMATDALAVAGRHLGIAALGSIEIVQATIVLVATAAMIVATAQGAHARVQIVLEQVRATTATTLLRVADALSALLLLWVAAGSIWLAADLWGGAEITEVLELPLRWLRLVWIVGALLVAFLFARRVVAGSGR